MTSTESAIHDFIASECFGGDPDFRRELACSAPLVTGGILDIIDLANLEVFARERFGTDIGPEVDAAIDGEDLRPVDTIDAIARLIEGRMR